MDSYGKEISQGWMETSGWQGLRSELHEGGGGVTQVPERRPPPQGQRESEKAALESRGHTAKYLKKQIAKEQMLFFKDNRFSISNNPSERL